MKILTVWEFGAALRTARGDRQLTQAQLAEAIGVSRYWVIRVERGEGAMELELVLRACRFLGLRLALSGPGEATRHAAT